MSDLKNSQEEDAWLVKEIEQCSEEAFKKLYRKYGPRVLQYVKRKFSFALQDAEDICQEVWKHVSVVCKSKRVQKPEKTAALIFKICKNKCIDHTRKNRGYLQANTKKVNAMNKKGTQTAPKTKQNPAVKDQEPLAEMPELPAGEKRRIFIPIVEELLQQNKTVNLDDLIDLRRCLKMLKARQIVLIELRFIQGYSWEKIYERVGATSKDALKMQASRAIKQLRRCMEV
ncbi:MAG: sigma-70 family RNA polymerase sigma factor [Calditrichaeota bacterium]|nr:MAG: sigma-70 family RNA polymerase sigma factor [Calditrichota bacterium]